MSQSLSLKKNDDTVIYSSFAPPPQIQVGFSTKGRTKQSFKAECDINQIMARFLRTGVLDFVQKNEPRYGDATGLEYQSAMLRVAGAKTMFNELPAKIREFFENEPGKFLDFVQNDKNHAECVEMGLLKPKAQPPEEGVPSSTPSGGHAPHEPLRARDGTFREHTRAEKRAEKAAGEAAEQRAASGKDQLPT